MNTVTTPANDTPSAKRRSAALRGVTYFVAWTIVAFATCELQFIAQPATNAQSYGRLLTMGLASCWLWAAFTPVILAFARRFRIEPTSWPRMLPLHLAAAAVVTFADVSIMHAITPWLSPDAPLGRAPIHIAFLRQLFLYSVCYFVIVALEHVRYYAGLSYERDLRAAQLEGQLAAARLTALQGQLRPHFLFNTLNMIAEQVYTDPAGADSMLTRLGVLLRSSFIETDRERVPLHRELELLESYVEIMRARFHGRLTFELDVDPTTLDALVPRFVLQPLVENAIKHGVEPREEGGRVTVTTRRQANVLTLEVRDNGDGLGGMIREGTGVRNTRERLHHLYGEGRQRFALTPGAGGGTVALLEIPFDTDDGPPASYTATSPSPAARGSEMTGVRRAPSHDEPMLPPFSGARPVLRRSVS